MPGFDDLYRRAVLATADARWFRGFVERNGWRLGVGRFVAGPDLASALPKLQAIEASGKGVSIEVGDLLPSSVYAERLKRVPPAWEKAFEINPSQDPAMRAACVEFVLAGLYAHQKISRSTKHGRVSYTT